MSDDLTTMAVNGSPAPCSVQDREEWVPPHYEGAADAPAYMLGPISKREMGHVVTRTNGDAGLPPDVAEVRDGVREAALAELDPEEATRVAADLERLVALEGVTDPEEDLAAELEQVRTRVTRHTQRLSRKSQPLRDLLTAKAQWDASFGDWLVRCGVRDWRGLAAPCTRRNGFVLDAAMLAVPERDRDALVSRILELTRVSRDLEQGSASP